MVQRVLLKRCLRSAPVVSKSISIRLTTTRNINVNVATATATRNFNSIGTTCTNNYNSYQIKNTKNHNQQQQQQRFKSFQSTYPVYNDETPTAAEPKAATPPATPTEDEVIPDYQNPLHHNDPENQKIFFEDFDENETPEMIPLPPIDDGSGNVVAAPHLHDLADEILKLSMYEMKELVDQVADHFGIEEGEDDDMGLGGGGGEVEEEVKEEKTAFDLKLTGFDAKSKIKVIKEVRAMTGLGLKEAKELVEGAPKTVMKDIKMEEAEALKAKIEAVGGTVEID